MDINVLRSKSQSMMTKELTIALTAYKMVRKIIAKSADIVGFSPQEDIFQKCTSIGRPVLLDKKGAYSTDGLQEDMEKLFKQISRHTIPYREGKRRHFPRKTKQGRYKKV